MLTIDGWQFTPDIDRDDRDSVSAHSVLSDFTGFAIAAFIAWKLTVSKAIKIAITPAIKNIHQLIIILY